MEFVGRNRVKHLVRDLYRAILGRDPDSDGARAYETLIRRIGPERAIPKILKAFRRSAEYRERADALAISHINATLASHGDRLVNGQPISHLVSLGSFCLPSLIFRDNGLRRYSLPFDWIFSTPQMVRDCLADDFALFLDRGYYRTNSGRSDPSAEHEFYRERYGLPGLFAHRDPTREGDYLHFVRCVTRFRQLLQSDDSKLFLVIGRANHELIKEFSPLLEALDRVTRNFVLLCIELTDPTERGLCALLTLAGVGEHTLYRFTPSSYNAEGGFLPDKLDEWTVLRLIYRYRLALKDSPWVESEMSESTDGAPDKCLDNRKAEHALT